MKNESEAPIIQRFNDSLEELELFFFAAIVDDETLIILVTLSQDTVETSCHRLSTIEMRDNNADQGHRAMRFRSSPFHWDAVNLCPC